MAFSIVPGQSVSGTTVNGGVVQGQKTETQGSIAAYSPIFGGAVAGFKKDPETGAEAKGGVAIGAYGSGIVGGSVTNESGETKKGSVAWIPGVGIALSGSNSTTGNKGTVVFGADGSVHYAKNVGGTISWA